MTTDPTRARLVMPVAMTVLVAWLASLGIGAVQQSWVPLEVTTPVMLLLAGYVFGVSITRPNGGDKP